LRQFRIVKTIFASLALVTLATAALPRFAAAEELTRSACWTFEEGSKRTLCFQGAGRVKMTNRNRTSDDKGWSTCEWTGLYLHEDTKVIVGFAPRSGKCSNGAASPQWSANCEFSGDDLDCRGSAIVDGKLYEVTLTFK
jgi:hypothetical protein